MPKVLKKKDEQPAGDSPQKKTKAKKPAVKKDHVQTEAPAVAKVKKVVENPLEVAGVPPDKDEAAELISDKRQKKDRYFEAVGRRKTSVARVRLFTKAGDFTVNDKPHSDYFPTMILQKDVEDALRKMKLFGRFRVSVQVSGGGIHSQAEAVRHGLSRCLIKFNPDFRKRLKRAGYLRRDPRMKERKKFGLKKARRAPQWAKR